MHPMSLPSHKATNKAALGQRCARVACAAWNSNALSGLVKHVPDTAKPVQTTEQPTNSNSTGHVQSTILPPAKPTTSKFLVSNPPPIRRRASRRVSVSPGPTAETTTAQPENHVNNAAVTAKNEARVIESEDPQDTVVLSSKGGRLKATGNATVLISWDSSGSDTSRAHSNDKTTTDVSKQTIAQTAAAGRPAQPGRVKRAPTPAWAPAGPNNNKLDSVTDGSTTTSNTDTSTSPQKKASSSWASGWSTGKRSATTGWGTSANVSSTRAGTDRASHNLTKIQNWSRGDEGKQTSLRASTATDSRVDATGPRVEQARDGAWVLAGCDNELAQLPSKVAALSGRLAAAIAAEQEAEKEALAALYSKTDVRKLQQEGVVLLGLRARRDGELYRADVWRFEASPAASKQPAGSSGHNSSRPELPYHKFRPGDSVLVSRVAESGSSMARTLIRQAASSQSDDDDMGGSDAWNVEGTVLEVKRSHVLLTLDRKDSERLEKFASLFAGKNSSSTWRLDASVRDVTAVRQREALSRLNHWVEGGKSITSGVRPVAGEALIRLSLTSDSYIVPVLAALPPLWVRDDNWRTTAKHILAQQTNLNASQRKAVSQAITRSLTLWQGPPGTGKTRTLLALVAVLVGSSARSAASWQAMGPVLACGDTNAAVDNLVEGLQAKGLRVVRVGNPAKVRASLRGVTLEAQAENDTIKGQQSVKIRKVAQAKLDAIAQARARRGVQPSSSSSSIDWSTEGAEEAAARQQLKLADSLLKEGMDEVLAGAHVVCATCAGAGDALLADRTFRVVVIDEASQATEPATLVPLTKGAQCVVMAGDPRQLPPTVTSRKALEYKLDVTLFDRLYKTGLQPLLLDTQYRMHPAVSEFPSAHFYGGKLKDGVAAHDKPTPKGLPWPCLNQPVVFLQVHGTEERASMVGTSKGNAELLNPDQQASRPASHNKQQGKDAPGGASYRNRVEAAAVMQVLERVLIAGDVFSVALLTPYKGQVRMLEGLLRQPSPALAAVLGSGQVDVNISSVDGFQGREADVVIFSAVRCNSQGSIGFVADLRRLNVAITRPRRGLVVVGSQDTLAAGSRDWDAYLTWLENKGMIVDANDFLSDDHKQQHQQQHQKHLQAPSQADDSAEPSSDSGANGQDVVTTNLAVEHNSDKAHYVKPTTLHKSNASNESLHQGTSSNGMIVNEVLRQAVEAKTGPIPDHALRNTDTLLQHFQGVATRLTVDYLRSLPLTLKSRMTKSEILKILAGSILGQ